MRNKSVILLAIALGCGMIASVGISQVVMSGGSGPVTQMVEILVASTDIPRDAKISAENIMLEKWPAGKLPEGALTDIADLEDKFAKQHIYAGEALLQQKVVDAAERKTVGISAGHTLVTYNISTDPGIANLVEPGDLVNVIGFFEKSDIVPETTHRDVFRNVKIFAVDGRTASDPEKKSSGTPSTVVLEIIKEDERAWNWAQKFGSLRLTLGNPNDYVRLEPGASNPAAQELMTWIEDARARRAADLAANQDSEPVVEEESGEIMKVMTPTGVKIYRWNKKTKTFKLIEDQTAGDSQLGEEADADRTPTLDDLDLEDPSGGESYSDDLPGTSFRLNRAR